MSDVPVIALLVSAAVGLGGCGDDTHGVRQIDEPAVDRAALESIRDQPPSHALDVHVVPGQYRFRERAIRAAAGTTSITIHNPTGVWHDVMVLDETRRGPAAWPYLGHQPDLPATGADRLATDTTVVRLRPGRYRLICNILGHLENGMSIPLDVVDAPGTPPNTRADTARRAVATLPSRRVTLVRAGRRERWDRTSARTRAGRVGFRLVNRTEIPTNLIVLTAEGRILTPDAPAIGRGQAGFALDLTPGEYRVINLAAGPGMSIPLHVH